MSLKTDNPVIREIVAFGNTLLIFLALFFIIRASIIEPFRIPSGSMIPTLRIGDHLFVSKLSYGFRLPFMTGFVYRWGTPKRGDIVVFTRPDEPETAEDESSINIIKRVIGLPGETLEVRDAKVYINGQPLNEPYARWSEGAPPEGNFGPVVVPPDHVIVLGDNRDHSKDSRFWSYHFLPIDRIKGRALFIYWSWDSLSRIGQVIR